MKKFNQSIFKSFAELFEDVDELFNDFGDNGNSYSSTVVDRYEDGELVSHREKVVKDGKVIKDVRDDKAIGNDEKKTIECNGKCEKSDQIKKFEDNITALESEVKTLKSIVKEREEENNALKKKLEAIKQFI